MSRQVPRSFISQARAQTAVKFNPELDALKYILQAAQSTKSQDIHNARNGAQFLIRAAAQARPQLLDGYKRLLGSTGAALQQYTADTGHVASQADQPSGAIRDEARIAADNLGLSAQAALSMLAQTQVRAAAEGNYQVNKAQAAYDSTRSQVANRAADIQRQSGDYGSSIVQQLMGDQTKRKFTAKQNSLGRQATAGNQSRTSDDKYLTKYGMTRAQFLALPQGQRQSLIKKAGSRSRSGGGTLPGGAKPLPISQQNTIINAIGEAQTWIDRLSASQHMTSHDIRAHLQAGDTLTDASGNKINLPKLSKLVVNAAYDLHAFGGLSRANVVALHNAGVKIKGRLKIIVPKAQGLQSTAQTFGAKLATS